MNRKVSVLLVVSLLIFSIDLPSKERRGAELVVTKNDGQVLRGELIAVKQNSVLLLSPEGVDVSVDIKDIDIIEIAKKSQVLKAGGIGFLAGALTGAILGAAIPDGDMEPRSLAVLAIAVMLGGVGFLVGALAGATSSRYKEIKIAGKSDAEISGILEELRHRARLPNAR